MGLHFLEFVGVAGLACTFEEEFCEFVEGDAFVLLMDGFKTVALFDPLYLGVVELLAGQGGSFQFGCVEDGVAEGVQEDEVVLCFLQPLADAEQSVVDFASLLPALEYFGVADLPHHHFEFGG
jgi:hypothetical protein